MGFPSVFVIVCGCVYSLMFCVIAYLDGIDGVKSFLSGSDSFLRRVVYEYSAELCRIIDNSLPKILRVTLRCGDLVASSIMFLSNRLSATAEFVIRESSAIAMIVMFVFCICSLIWNYEEVKGFLVAVIELVKGVLGALFSIVNDPAKLSEVVMLLLFPQFLFILLAVLMKDQAPLVHSFTP